MGDHKAPEVQKGFRNFQLSEGIGYRASLRGDVDYLVVMAEGKSMFYRAENLGIGVKLGVDTSVLFSGTPSAMQVVFKLGYRL